MSTDPVVPHHNPNKVAGAVDDGPRTAADVEEELQVMERQVRRIATAVSADERQRAIGAIKAQGIMPVAR